MALQPRNVINLNTESKAEAKKTNRSADGKENKCENKSKTWSRWGVKPTWPSWRTPPKERKPDARNDGKETVQLYAYERGPVYKRSSLKQLPGHTCLMCKPFYDDLRSCMTKCEMKNMKNVASRHRYQFKRSESPANIWKLVLKILNNSAVKCHDFVY